MTTFGERMKAIRLQRGLSQQEFAQQLGTSKQVISRYETNQRIPKVTVAESYAKKLGVSLYDLMGEDVPPPTTANETGGERLRVLARNLDRIPQEQRERVLKSFEDTIDLYLEAMQIPSDRED